MKILLTLIIMTALMGNIANAQITQEEKEVNAAVEQLRAAMVSGDKTALENVAGEALSYGHSGGYVENKAQFVENIVSGKSDFVSIELSNQTISIVDNAAIVRHDLAAATNDGGKPGNVNLHVLSVWQKQKGKWKMIARQAVKVQPKN